MSYAKSWGPVRCEGLLRLVGFKLTIMEREFTEKRIKLYI